MKFTDPSSKWRTHCERKKNLQKKMQIMMNTEELSIFGKWMAKAIGSTSKLQLVVPLMEYPLAWSSLPGKASPVILSPSMAGNGSSSATAHS
jgi:hypothetical protein